MSKKKEVIVPKVPNGSEVWIPDPDDVWTSARYIGFDAKHSVLKLFVHKGKIERTMPHGTNILMRNPELKGGFLELTDLTQLVHLHEAALLHSLNQRFDSDFIYTNTGPILIAVNPFKMIEGMYDFKTLSKYLKSKETGVIEPPHVFSIAQAAYEGMCSKDSCQTILISGESGAGKTESTKFVMKLLALAGSKDWNNRSPVEQQVLQSNPLLEAFGNAKTLRNDNSSRFGKFIEMQFRVENEEQPDKRMEMKGRLAGARIHTYLLESVRVCNQLEGERAYHIFYQLCAASQKAQEGIYNFPQKVQDSAEAKIIPMNLNLSNFRSWKSFRILTNSSCGQLSRIDDVEEFEATIAAMQTIGIPNNEIVQIFEIIAAVLHLGNVKFQAPKGNSEASTPSPSTQANFSLVSEILGIPDIVLEKCLTTRTIRLKSETLTKSLTVNESDDTRDSICRALYATMFLKLVKKTNASIGYNPSVKLFCGVLDIFGFECFEKNSFEQLCINFTNERLQQFFNVFIFKCEEELYAAEAIPWDPLDFPDNQDCVDLLMVPRNGLFAMLDEECIVPQGSDQGFCNKIKDKYKDHKRFGILKIKPDWFLINHFAGNVAYSSEQFLDKNRDTLSQDAEEAIKAAKNEFAADLFNNFLRQEELEQSKKAKKKPTVSSEFKNQLNTLMASVNATDPHFIRCIKPNSKNCSDLFERISVVEQLRYGGVLQAVQVSRAGYPIRLGHKDFCLDYHHLCKNTKLITKDPPNGWGSHAHTVAKALSEDLKIPKPKHSIESFAVGKTMVFLKHEAFEILSNAKAVKQTEMSIRIQSIWKRCVEQRKYAGLKIATQTMQNCYRKCVATRKVENLRRQKAALVIQNSTRKLLAQVMFRTFVSAIIFFQSAARVRNAQAQFVDLKKQKSSIIICKSLKSFKERNNLKNCKLFAICIQNEFRRKLSTKEYKKLIRESKEADSLRDQKAILQSQMAALKKQLEDKDKDFDLEVKRRMKAASVTSSVPPMDLTGPAFEVNSQVARTPPPAQPQDNEQIQALVEQHRKEMEEKEAQIAALKSQLKNSGIVLTPSTKVTTTGTPRDESLSFTPHKTNKKIPLFLEETLEKEKHSSIVSNVIDVATFDIKQAVLCVAFSKPTKSPYTLIAVGGKEGGLVLFRVFKTELEAKKSGCVLDANGGEVVRHAELKGHKSSVTCVLFSYGSGQERVISGDLNNRIHIWSTNGSMLFELKDTKPIISIALNPVCGKDAFFVSNSQGCVRVINPTDIHDSVKQKIQMMSPVTIIVVEQSIVFFGMIDGSVAAYRMEDTNRLKKIWEKKFFPQRISDIVFGTIGDVTRAFVSVCENFVYVMRCDFHSQKVTMVYETRFNTLQMKLPLKGSFSKVNGGVFLCGSESNYINILSMRQQKGFTGGQGQQKFEQHQLHGHKSYVLVVGVNEENTAMVSGDASGVLKVWRCVQK